MTPQDSTKVTFSQVYQDFKGALSGAADALKVGSEHVYAVLVRQQMVNAITYSFLICGLALISAILIRNAIKMAKDSNGEWEWDNNSPCIAFMVIGGFFGLFASITFCVCIGDIIMGILNPEYGAIQEVREFIQR